MAKIFEIPELTLRELNNNMYNLYKFFSEVVSGLESKNSDWNSVHEINYELSPHSYYNFTYHDKQVRIHRNRGNTYSLECKNIVLTKIKPSKFRRRSTSDYRYQNYYGDFDTLDEAVTAFSNVVRAVCSDNLGEFF